MHCDACRSFCAGVWNTQRPLRFSGGVPSSQILSAETTVSEWLDLFSQFNFLAFCSFDFRGIFQPQSGTVGPDRTIALPYPSPLSSMNRDPILVVGKWLFVLKCRYALNYVRESSISVNAKNYSTLVRVFAVSWKRCFAPFPGCAWGAAGITGKVVTLIGQAESAVSDDIFCLSREWESHGHVFIIDDKWISFLSCSNPFLCWIFAATLLSNTTLHFFLQFSRKGAQYEHSC